MTLVVDRLTGTFLAVACQRDGTLLAMSMGHLEVWVSLTVPRLRRQFSRAGQAGLVVGKTALR